MIRTKEFLDREKNCFTQSQKRLYPDIVIAEGHGATLVDFDGKEYIDLLTTSCVLGHRHPKLEEACIRQMGKLDHTYPQLLLNEPVLLLAERLKEIAPGHLKDGKVLYACSGTEAVEFAVKLARCYTAKPVLISYYWAHHGYSPGVIAFTSDLVQTKAEYAPSVSNVVYAPYPFCYRCALEHEFPECNYACLEYVRKTLQLVVSPKSVAGVIIEPLLGWSGFVVPPDDYMRKLSKLCKDFGVLLIDDEVLVGMGRSGKMFGVEHWNVHPDIMILGKGVGFGFPLGAIMASAEMIDGWKTGAQGGAVSSPSGNAVACAVSVEGIDVIRNERLVEKAASLESHIMKRLEEMASKHRLIGNFRGKGILASVELVRDQKTKEPAPEEASEVIRIGMKHGVLWDKAGSFLNVVRMLPPLTITNEELNRCLDVLDLALKKVESS